MGPDEQKEVTKQKGRQLIERIESESSDWSGLARNWSSFLKECELVWSTGQPSCIYNFKLKEVEASGKRVASCLADIHRLNLLLLAQKTFQKF